MHVRGLQTMFRPVASARPVRSQPARFGNMRSAEIAAVSSAAVQEGRRGFRCPGLAFTTRFRFSVVHRRVSGPSLFMIHHAWSSASRYSGHAIIR